MFGGWAFASGVFTNKKKYGNCWGLSDFFPKNARKIQPANKRKGKNGGETVAEERTCKKCKALKTEYGEFCCELGYKIDDHKVAPLEICPRPLLYTDLIELRKERTDGNL